MLTLAGIGQRRRGFPATNGLGRGERRPFGLCQSRKADSASQRQVDLIGESVVQLSGGFLSRPTGSDESAKAGNSSRESLVPTERSHQRKLHRISAVAGQIVHGKSISKNDAGFKAILAAWREESRLSDDNDLASGHRRKPVSRSWRKPRRGSR